jgi:GMP synthase (glutamine-hydrolysing)
MSRHPVLLYVLGHPPDPVAAAHGPFRRWFERIAGDTLDLRVFDGTTGAVPASPEEFAGAVLTGSPASMTEPEPWMEIAVEWLRHAAHAGTPVLGVCFGHQLIGAAYGGSVIKNPCGWEMSTHAVELTEDGRADLLFEGLDHRFDVNLSHADIVDADTLAPANGIRVLARNPMSEVQALAAGDSIRGVQFHPELTGAITRSYVEHRRDRLADPDAMAARARNCPAGAAVFANFTKHWIQRA